MQLTHVFHAVADRLEEIEDNLPELSPDDVAAWVAGNTDPEHFPCEVLEAIGFLRGICATLDLSPYELFAAARAETMPLAN